MSNQPQLSPAVAQNTPMNFDDRLRRALERGEKTRDALGRAALARELSVEELRAMHSSYRLDLSDHIEECLLKLVDHVPGFKYQSVVSDDGWGGRLLRDDLHLTPGRPPESRHSRLEVLISPFSPNASILELVVKGTVRNREVLNRKHYQKLVEFDRDAFMELIDQRVLEFAELYAATH
ncbi:hypothetical protein [Planctomicrobium sp. SH664]|uniref:hypothetical protein n=1 Tax=Planctomicrobium sp. SH664 TaxID=3448125 RepID=UPI003F5C6729